MKAEIIRIGNSRGIRIPKALLEQCGLENEVELEVKDKTLIVSSPKQARQGWDQAFATAAGQGKDVPLDAHTSTKFDEEEWEW
jgi:antitoxin MazE